MAQSRLTSIENVSTDSLTQRLIGLLTTHSLRRGSFALSSGALSNHYIDARLTTMRPEGLTTIAELSLLRLAAAGWFPSAIGGLTLGADPIAYAIAYRSAVADRPVRAFTVRKEAKQHGTQQLVEGPLSPNDDVVIVEDVLTTGRSALRAIEAVRSLGCKVLGVLAVVDREEGGVRSLSQAGVETISLVTVSQLLTAPTGQEEEGRGERASANS